VRRADAASIHGVVAGIAAEVPGRPLMVQSYLPEIEEGEWSLIFLGGAFAHAVLKRPAPGEFRINSRFGGTRAAVSPPRAMIADGEHVASLLPEVPLYARIDGVMRDGRLLCTELELTDPNLYFDLAPESAQKLASLTLAHL
ncbi:MAG TPA: hypothetical protein VG742_10190, partial [Dongiaceae bacterium]|nr:hypothetical protein [Dongiaceae bacterium]